MLPARYDTIVLYSRHDAFGDGLILHRLTVDPEAPIRSSVEVAVRACMD